MHVPEIQTYAALSRLTNEFIAGRLRNSVVVESAPGLGKSVMSVEAANDQTVILDNANMSAVGFYQYLYDHLDKNIVICDPSVLLGEKEGRRLMQALLDTRPVRTVSWLKQNGWLESEGIPRQFQTATKVFVYCNKDGTQALLDGDPAILDRVVFRRFTPPPKELREKTAVHADDQELFDAWSVAINFRPDPSMRMLERSKRVKAAGLDWWEELLVGTELDDLEQQIVRRFDPLNKPHGYGAKILRAILAEGIRAPRQTFYRGLQKIEEATAWIYPLAVQGKPSEKWANPAPLLDEDDDAEDDDTEPEEGVTVENAGNSGMLEAANSQIPTEPAAHPLRLLDKPNRKQKA